MIATPCMVVHTWPNGATITYPTTMTGWYAQAVCGNEVIDSFHGVRQYLSNFWICDVPYQGLVYPSSEHAYQAAKSIDMAVRQFFTNPQTTAGQAKKAGRRVQLRSDWSVDTQLRIMTEIVCSKFDSNPELAGRLYETAPAILVEGNTWGDRFWGVCQGHGHNWLGQILMDVRDIIVTHGLR